MNAGKLRHRVALQSCTTAKDAAGEDIRTYSTYDTVWAEIKALAGRELESAQQISEEITYKINIRYHTTVVSDHRILFGARIFEIVTVTDPDERNIELNLMCKEIK
jgi:SPP1 family predicted phage head-tail adaptor